MIRIKCIPLFLAILFIAGRFVFPQACPEPAGVMGLGNTISIAYSDNLVVAGMGDALTVFDMSESGHITKVGQTLLYGPITDIELSGSFAYVTDGYGMAIVDISDPVFPNVVSQYGTYYYSQSVAVVDHIAYVADDLNGLVILDISDPTNPKCINQIETAGWAMDVYVCDNRLYLLDATFPSPDWILGDGLLLYDVSIPETPCLIGSFQVPGFNELHSIFVDEKIAFIASGYDGLRIIDCTDPANIHEIGFYFLPNIVEYFRGVTVAGGDAYIATSKSGLRIIDITDLSNPVEIGALDENLPHISISGRDVVVKDDYALLAAGSAGIIVIDLTIPTRPQLNDHYFAPYERVSSLAIKEHYLFMASWLRIWIIDIANLLNPIAVNHIDYYLYNDCHANQMEIQGDLLGLTCDFGGIKFLDISNPINPVEISGYATVDPAYEIEISSQHAFVVTYDEHEDIDDLLIFDISNPRVPALISSFKLSYSTYGQISLSDHYLFLVGYYDGCLHQIDISDILAPTEVGVYCVDAWNVVNHDGLTYVSVGSHGMRIYDTSSPPDIHEVGSYEDGIPIYCLEVGSDTVYATGVDSVVSRFSAINVSDPSSPSGIAHYDRVPELYHPIKLIEAGYVYLLSLYDLEIFDVSGCAASGRTHDRPVTRPTN